MWKIAHEKSTHIEITILQHTTDWVDILLRIWHIYGDQEQQLGIKCYLLNMHVSNKTFVDVLLFHQFSDYKIVFKFSLI
jgi:hypothetical protein